MTKPLIQHDLDGKSCIIWSELIRTLNRMEDQIVEYQTHQDDAFRHSPTLRQFLLEEFVRFFPDGSAQIDDVEDALEFYHILVQYSRATGGFRECKSQFRSIAHFLNRNYLLFTTEEYFDQTGGEENLHICPVELTPWQQGENDACNLLVRVQFWGGLPKASRPLFSQAMAKWQDSVALSGIWGSGSALLFPDSFLFDKRWASFRVDVSRSSQDTLNWLTLSILNFAAKHTPVSWIRYGDRESELE